ncbi:Fe-S protein assembly co-chaperone HscB [Buchnera aphidicola]|uniref:Fe-S protein assembly co-chaperone HscB n=1 Tax=Buchnera aphidicola TaxID=9 RepID=UPI0020938D63|nr:Fe-S protein assembly co-chaperone HscB [Buchnera aphidicola]USS94131.1 Fe-S protein assembly co-chaperone HscB [Buchnera aphidicola (Sipha maydis)]
MFNKKKKNILKRSIYINKGYQILKNTIKRIQYLLKINGFDIKSNKTHNTLDQKFLYKQYKLYKKLNKIQQKKNKKAILNFIRKIDSLFKKNLKKIKIKLIKKSWKKSYIIFQKIIFLKNFKKKIK